MHTCIHARGACSIVLASTSIIHDASASACRAAASTISAASACAAAAASPAPTASPPPASAAARKEATSGGGAPPLAGGPGPHASVGGPMAGRPPLEGGGAPAAPPSYPSRTSRGDVPRVACRQSSSERSAVRLGTRAQYAPRSMSVIAPHGREWRSKMGALTSAATPLKRTSPSWAAERSVTVSRTSESDAPHAGSWRPPSGAKGPCTTSRRVGMQYT